MHQTFYIDIDEEITSIVDRLRKAKTEEIVIVVPKRALLIQSLVNLKLLKKEADNLKIQLMIVTQDKLGKLLVEKAGILVQNKLDENLEEEVLVFEDEKKEKDKSVDNSAVVNDKEIKSKNRFEELGSAEFAGAKNNVSGEISVKEDASSGKKEDFERIINKELVTHVSREVRAKKPLFGKSTKAGNSLDMVRNIDIEEGISRAPSHIFGMKKKNLIGSGVQENKLADFFSSQSRNLNETPAPSPISVSEKPIGKIKPRKKIVSSGNSWRVFTFFGLGLAVILIAAGAYFFLPQAVVTIFAKVQSAAIDTEVKGDSGATEINFDSKIIPAKLISVETEITGNFPATGNKSIASKKARGMITIYNEYSSSSQPLVATTRFLSEDGKLFRLSSGVTVPGTTKASDGSIQPGKIEAEIVADEAGESYNIGPGKFLIPGFKDSGEEKYAKIYGRTEKNMTGGGSGGEEAKSITTEDIANAKTKVSGDVENALREKIKDSLSSDMAMADDGINFEEAQYRISNNVGEVTNNFSVTVSGKASALIFSEEDLQSVLEKQLLRGGEIQKIERDSIKIEFGKSSLDSSSSSIIMKIHATAESLGGVDPESIKKGILGKNENELKGFLGNYPTIEKVTVDYWPSFVSGKIPLFERQVTVVLDKI